MATRKDPADHSGAFPAVSIPLDVSLDGEDSYSGGSHAVCNGGDGGRATCADTASCASDNL